MTGKDILNSQNVLESCDNRRTPEWKCRCRWKCSWKMSAAIRVTKLYLIIFLYMSMKTIIHQL